MFDSCGEDSTLRFSKYVDGIVNSINHIFTTFRGAEIHDNLVILVPDGDFKEAVLPLLTLAFDSDRVPSPGITMVDSTEGAFAINRTKKSPQSRIVVDTLESFDGMERLFVLAVGLDSVQTVAGCCGIYRAITRAHMFVCVVQEHLKGGWLEFTANMQRDQAVAFDEAHEREQVARENLTIIMGVESKPTDLGDGDLPPQEEPRKEVEVVGLMGAQEIPEQGKADVFACDHDQGGGVQGVGQDVLPGETALAIPQNVWNVNRNANAFKTTVNWLSFNPVNPNSFSLDLRMDDVTATVVEATTTPPARFPLSNRSLNGGDYSVALQIVRGGTAATAGIAIEGLSCYTMRVDKARGVVRSPVCGWGPGPGNMAREDVFQTVARLATLQCGVDVVGWGDRLCTLLQRGYEAQAPYLRVRLYDRGYGQNKGAKQVPEVAILVVLDPDSTEGAALLSPLVEKDVGCNQPRAMHGANTTHDLRWITVRELFQDKAPGTDITYTVRGDRWLWYQLLPSKELLTLPAGGVWQVSLARRFGKAGSLLAVADHKSAAALQDWLILNGFSGGKYATMADLRMFCAKHPHTSQRLTLQPPSMVSSRYPEMLEWNPSAGGGIKAVKPT